MALTSAPGHAVDRRHRHQLVRRLVMLETIAAAIDKLLDHEQRDQETAQRDRRIKRGDRRHRRHAEGGKAAQEIEVTKINETERDAEHDHAGGDLDHQAGPAVQHFRQRREIEMIVAAGGDGGADKDRIDEEGRGDLLQPEPGMADLAGDDIQDHRGAETEQQYAAPDHQHDLEPIQRRPLQRGAAASSPGGRQGS